jgi:hypothetical protein
MAPQAAFRPGSATNSLLKEFNQKFDFTTADFVYVLGLVIATA